MSRARTWGMAYTIPRENNEKRRNLARSRSRPTSWSRTVRAKLNSERLPRETRTIGAETAAIGSLRLDATLYSVACGRSVWLRDFVWLLAVSVPAFQAVVQDELWDWKRSLVRRRCTKWARRGDGEIKMAKITRMSG